MAPEVSKKCTGGAEDGDADSPDADGDEDDNVT